jgi:hypothetical protein
VEQSRSKRSRPDRSNRRRVQLLGAHEELAIDLNENSDGDTVLSIHGYATFDVSKPIHAEDGSVVDREQGYTEEFLERIAPHLEEQLVIETVGHEKCRFPLLAGQWSVWPDGTIQHESFNPGPEKFETTDDSETQYGVACCSPQISQSQ